MFISFFLFAFSIFLSSFLLFQVQPIISKYILPWFGGTTAVWTTAMLFFQTFHDAIPMHLLTKEAFEIYLQRIDPRSGIIAVHISNNYINLRPLLIQVAKHFGLSYVIITSQVTGHDLQSEWVLLTKNQSLLHAAEITKANEHTPQKQVTLWTDDYSNLFQLLK